MHVAQHLLPNAIERVHCFELCSMFFFTFRCISGAYSDVRGQIIYVVSARHAGQAPNAARTRLQCCSPSPFCRRSSACLRKSACKGGGGHALKYRMHGAFLREHAQASAAHLCCTGGMPSFSSTRSFILSMVSVGSISISISLPVKVLTLIISPPRSRNTRWRVDSFWML